MKMIRLDEENNMINYKLYAVELLLEKWKQGSYFFFKFLIFFLKLVLKNQKFFNFIVIKNFRLIF